MYSSIAYAVVKEEEGLGGGRFSMYESDVDGTSAAGTSASASASATGTGEDAET